MSHAFSSTPSMPGDPLMEKLREILIEHRGIALFVPLSDEDGPSSTVAFEVEPTFDQLMLLSAKYTAAAMLFAEDVIEKDIGRNMANAARALRTKKLHAATHAVFKLLKELRDVKGNEG